MEPFIAVFVLGAIIGGFAGGLLTGATFSFLWAFVGGVGIFGVLFLGWLVFIERRRQKKDELTPEMRGVFDRLLRSKGVMPPGGKQATSLPGLQEAIVGLARQRRDQEAIGERPETMLIPHIRIKLDIIIKAYQSDLNQVIERIGKSDLPMENKVLEETRMRKQLAKTIYELKREPRATIEGLFEDMGKHRPDFVKFERAVRAENPRYRIVGDLGLR